MIDLLSRVPSTMTRLLPAGRGVRMILMLFAVNAIVGASLEGVAGSISGYIVGVSIIAGLPISILPLALGLWIGINTGPGAVSTFSFYVLAIGAVISDAVVWRFVQRLSRRAGRSVADPS
jgi:hypothetical protein